MIRAMRRATSRATMRATRRATSRATSRARLLDALEREHPVDGEVAAVVAQEGQVLQRREPVSGTAATRAPSARGAAAK
eukprot:4099995-Prymnesium_polylepis.1